MTWRERARSWLREPLVHFLVAGTLVFALLSGRGPDPGERRIVVDEPVVTRLVERWTMTYRRPPTQDEIDGLIREWVKDQVYYREALRLGLDRDDEVVVRRMRLKMTSLATAEAETREPSDAELQALLDKDPARYAGEPAYTFRQVYLGDDKPEVRALVSKYLAALSGGVDATMFNLPTPLPERFSASASDIAGQFGDEFVTALGKVRPGSWQGPIASGLGLHLVLVERIDRPPPPALADIRQQLANDWRSERLRRAEEDGYRKLLGSYDVVIKDPR